MGDDGLDADRDQHDAQEDEEVGVAVGAQHDPGALWLREGRQCGLGPGRLVVAEVDPPQRGADQQAEHRDDDQRDVER